MAHSWRWHIFHRHVITCWGRADLCALLYLVFSCFFFVTFPYGVSGQLWYLIVSISGFCPLLYFYIGKTNQIFLSEMTMPSTLIFGMQHHLVSLYPFNSIWGTVTIKWTHLRALTFTIGIYWGNFLVWHHKV